MPGERELGLVYDAAVDPSRWPDVLEMLVVLAGASFGSISMERAAGGGTGVSVRLDPEILERYLAISNMTAPLRLGPEIPTGRVVTDREVAPREMLTASPYYRDYLQPSGINSIAAAVLWRGDGLKCCLSLDRSPGREEFEQDELQQVQDLAPHLARAIGVSSRLGDAASAVAADAALEGLAHGVILLDCEARVLFANSEGEAVLAARDGLGVVRDRLAPSHDAATAKLASAVARASTASGVGAALRLDRPSGRRPLAVLVTPYRPRDADWLGGGRARVIVVVTDPDRNLPAPEMRLMQLYAFTRTEAAICAELLVGRTLGEIAEQRKISLRTARVHLGHILAKAGAERQAELLRLLLRETAAI